MKTLGRMDSCVKERTYVLLVAVSALVLHLHHAYGNSNCVNNISIPRSTEYNRSAGEPLTVECPVQFCSQQPPNVTWCKVSGDTICQAIAGGPGIAVQWEERRRNDGVYLLKFVSVHENDTGFYKCWAEFGTQQTVGHVIKINILAAVVKGNTTMDKSENTRVTPSLDLKNMEWLLYLSFSLLGLSVFILIISLLVYYLRKVKQKASASPEEPEDKTEIPPECSSNAQLQLESATNGLVTNENVAVAEETSNDNKEPTLDYAEEQDSILYADLKHDVNRVTNTWHVDDGEIEYATVRINVALDDSQ
ncbi:B- and T-lymphocyte attenuator [Spea bombifrons]|uniref:B- and T-lymphocyte attenuator n=1 Tax=Spea bombifrons TaxID=233779 RepID=UPI00234938A2|nr:B- and T-lymphocyte attenuator [Spea bombifrons]